MLSRLTCHQPLSTPNPLSFAPIPIPLHNNQQTIPVHSQSSGGGFQTSLYMTLPTYSNDEVGLISILIEDETSWNSGNKSFYVYHSDADGSAMRISKFDHLENSGGLDSRGALDSKSELWVDSVPPPIPPPNTMQPHNIPVGNSLAFSPITEVAPWTPVPPTPSRAPSSTRAF